MKQSIIMLMIALFTTVSMSAQSNGNRKLDNNKKQSNTEKVYIKSKNATTFHKSKNCKKIKNTSNIKSITFEKAMKKELKPCSTCFEKNSKDKDSYRKNSNNRDNDENFRDRDDDNRDRKENFRDRD